MKTFKTAKGTELPFRDFRGQDYLDVKYRILWFREEKPMWTIDTDFIHLDTTSALARAVVRDESGRAIQTAHKFEDKAGFADFREKAETGAVGRALAMIGYGTQFAQEMDEPADKIVDSPVAPKSSSKPKETARAPNTISSGPVGTLQNGPKPKAEAPASPPNPEPASDAPRLAGQAERTHVMTMVGKNGWTMDDVIHFIDTHFKKKKIFDLTMPQYHELTVAMARPQ